MELERKESVDWQVVSEKCFAQKTCQCDRDHGCEVVRAAMARETVANLLRQYDDSTAAYNQLRTINAGLQDENETLRADLRSATASYRKALDAKNLLEAADQLRWDTWNEAIGDAAVGLMDKMRAFIDSDAMASAIYKFGQNSAKGNDSTDWDKVDRSSLERMREWYNDSQAENRALRAWCRLCNFDPDVVIASYEPVEPSLDCPDCGVNHAEEVRFEDD